MTASEYPGKLISAASIASPFQLDISEAIKRRRDGGKPVPKLIGILATPSPPSVAYAEWTKKACEQVGIEFEIWKTWHEKTEAEIDADRSNMEGLEGRPDTDLEADVEDLIIAANADDSIHGIMVYYPIFGGRQDTYLQQIVDPRKDVEGLHFSYCWNMYHNVRWILPHQLGGAPGTTTEAGVDQGEEIVPPGFAKSILPCTPLAVVKCLEAMGVYDRGLPYGDRLYGKVITVINRSEVVGRPLAALLSNDGAKVFSIDLDSLQEFNKRATIEKDRKPSEAVTRAREKNSQRKLRSHHTVRPCVLTTQQCIEASDVVISGVPSANFKIQTDWIKSDAITVNFSSEKNFEKDVRRRASKHLPAIGKTTIAMLQRNLLRLVEYREMGAAKGIGGSDFHNGGGGGSGGDDDSGDDGKGGRRGDHDRENDGSSDRSNMLKGGNASQSLFPTGDSSRGGRSNYDEMTHKTRSAADDTALFLTPDKSIRRKLGDGNFGCRHRSNTVTLPTTSCDQNSNRTHSHPSTHLYSDWTYPHHRSSITSNSTSGSSFWDWRNSDESRRESVISGITTIASRDSPSPRSTKLKSQHQVTLPSMMTHNSPLIFGPVSPFGANTSCTSSSRGSVYPASSLSLLEKPSSISSPRSATPISPLMIDHLSVDDGNYSHSKAIPIPSTPFNRDAKTAQAIREAQQLILERPMKDLPVRSFHPFAIPVNADRSSTSAMSSRDSNASSAPSERISQNRRRRRPPFSYSSLIAQAISSSPEGRMTLREIYTWISQAYPDLYSMDGNEGSGWQNTVRHNLSLNKCFVKVARTAKDIYESCSSGLPSQSQAARGKGGWWTLDHSIAQAQLGNYFRRDSLGSNGSTGGNTPVASSLDTNQRRNSQTPSVLQSAHQAESSDRIPPSPRYAMPQVQVKHFEQDQPGQYISSTSPSKQSRYQSSLASSSCRSIDDPTSPLHSNRKLSMSESSEYKRSIPLVSARRSSVSSNQYSTIKRKLPFGSPSDRDGNEPVKEIESEEQSFQQQSKDRYYSHDSIMSSLPMQRLTHHQPGRLSNYSQFQNQNIYLKKSYPILPHQQLIQQHQPHHHLQIDTRKTTTTSPLHQHRGATLYNHHFNPPSSPLSKSHTTLHSNDMQLDTTTMTVEEESRNASGRLAINELLNS